MLKKEQPFVLVDAHTGKKALSLKLVEDDKAGCYYALELSDLLPHNNYLSRSNLSSHQKNIVDNNDNEQDYLSEQEKFQLWKFEDRCLISLAAPALCLDPSRNDNKVKIARIGRDAKSRDKQVITAVATGDTQGNLVKDHGYILQTYN